MCFVKLKDELSTHLVPGKLREFDIGQGNCGLLVM